MTRDNEKMAKSKGNTLSVADLRQSWSGDVLRYFLLSTHYRKPLDINQQALRAAHASLERICVVLRSMPQVAIAQHCSPFFQYLCDDLNTPQALTLIHEYIRQFHKSQVDKTRYKIASIIKFCTQFIAPLQLSLIHISEPTRPY